MTPKYGEQPPISFSETVELVKNYVRVEIVQEAQNKQLYYHNLDHASAVERRGNLIFQAIRPVLSQNYSSEELTRLEGLISICGLAHDMVQIFEPTPLNHPRKRLSGLSETETANKLLQYIGQLNQVLAREKLDVSCLFSDREQEIIRDAITATICIQDPQGSRAEDAKSPYSIYQPYLYDHQSKVSIVGIIIALADLGTLGIDGVEAYVNDGRLIFFEDNPHLDLSALDSAQQEAIRSKLLAMSCLIVDFAHERQARFEEEIAGFLPQIRRILRQQVFVYLNQESINQVQVFVPSGSNASLTELINFFCLDKIRTINN